jgi:hypothetical protein
LRGNARLVLRVGKERESFPVQCEERRKGEPLRVLGGFLSHNSHVCYFNNNNNNNLKVNESWAKLRMGLTY